MCARVREAPKAPDEKRQLWKQKRSAQFPGFRFCKVTANNFEISFDKWGLFLTTRLSRNFFFVAYQIESRITKIYLFGKNVFFCSTRILRTQQLLDRICCSRLLRRCHCRLSSRRRRRLLSCKKISHLKLLLFHSFQMLIIMTTLSFLKISLSSAKKVPKFLQNCAKKRSHSEHNTISFFAIGLTWLRERKATTRQTTRFASFESFHHPSRI